tara:strand:+ start:310 stop:693 length:384 start_codon:yes stop_codon:yes gene_type:complete
MNKLSSQEEKELIVIIKDWLRSHGYSQKDLAGQLKIKSSRTSEIINKLRDLYKKGGIINIAKNLIKIEQYWISANINDNEDNNKNNNNEEYSYSEENNRKGYNQLDLNYKLDLDELMDKMEQDHKIN